MPRATRPVSCGEYLAFMEDGGYSRQELFAARYPFLAGRIDFGPHRRFPRGVHPDQLTLFE